MLSTILILGVTGILAVLAGIKSVVRLRRGERLPSLPQVSRRGNRLFGQNRYLGHVVTPADYVPRERLDDEDFE